MQMIKAKMTCHGVQENRHAQGVYAEHVVLYPVYSPNPESPNYTWSKATPAGRCELTITNPEAFGAFRPGRDYELSFVEVVPEA